MSEHQHPPGHDPREGPFHIIVDNKRHEWANRFITGLEIKRLAGVDPATYDAWQDVPGPEDIPVGDTDKADLSKPGTEKFFTGKKTTTEG